MSTENNRETPDTIYGRLLESVHISGYSAARACDELEWLLDEDRWKAVGKGFSSGDDFIRTINLSEFRLAVDQRKKLARKLAEIQGTQRVIGQALGVTQTTVGRDLETNVSGNKHQSTGNEPDTDATETSVSLKEPPTPITKSGSQAAAELKRHDEAKKKRDEKETKKADKQSRKSVVPTIDGPERLQLIAADFINAPVAEGSVDWIITDPPYPSEFLPEFGKLALFAARVLKDGGSLICMCGQSYLPQIYAALAGSLNYQWTLSYLTPGGQSVQVFPRKVNTFWKPLLWFTKGEYQGDWIGDVCKSAVNDNDKRFHEWGQSESGMADIIERFTFPGDLICDPFLGGGTTGIVSVQLNRRFIGIDINKQAIETSKARLEAAIVVE